MTTLFADSPLGLPPPTPELLARLRKLADDPGFDAGDYLVKSCSEAPMRRVRCDLCHVAVAPDGVCGYCRMRVRLLRTEAARAAG